MSAGLLTMVGLAYLCGAIPFGVLVGKMKGVDVRAVGSGNSGATNVWRALGPAAGASVFLLDAFKGWGATYMAMNWLPESKWEIALCALVVVSGHMFSVFLRFRGGKGIATAFGAMLCMVPLVALGCLVWWAAMLVASRTISFASIAACVVAPFALALAHAPYQYGSVVLIFAMAAILKHLPNMKRMIAGTEPRLGTGKSAGVDPNASASASAIASADSSSGADQPGDEAAGAMLHGG